MTDVAVTSGDLIPIMNDAGGGVYTLGRNSARSNRVGTYGAVFQPDASGITPRAGVLTDRQSSLGGLWVHQQVTANQTVLVESGQAVIPRTGQGGYLFTNEAVQTVAMPAASSVNARYDLVCAFAADKGTFGSDAVHGPQFHVESGGVSGTPTIPATPAGMVALGAFLRPVNNNTIIDGQATDQRKSTCLRGALRRMMGGDALTDPGLLIGERRETLTGTDRWDGTAWRPMETFGQVPQGRLGTVKPTAAITAATAATEFAAMSITLTLPAGRKIAVRWHGDMSSSGTATGVQLRIRAKQTATVDLTGAIIDARDSPINGGSNTQCNLDGDFTTGAAGSYVFVVSFQPTGGTNATQAYLVNVHQPLVTVDDVGGA